MESTTTGPPAAAAREPGRSRRAASASPLLRWVSDPDPGRGIHFAGADGGWEHWPYDRLAAHVRRMAAGMLGAGVAPDDRVVVVERTGPAFVAAYFGAMLAGAVPVPATPPALGQDAGRYQAYVGGLLASARPALLATSGALRERLAPVAEAAGVPRCASTEALLRDAGELGDRDAAARPLADLAMLQFTSGSSGRPHGVRVPFPALEANVAAIAAWLAMTGDDVTASWLPAHHDMGLIGCLLTPVTLQGELWLLAPEHFVRDPLRYLRCFGEAGARLTAMPTFGLEHVVRRVAPEELRGMDFSGWRAVIVGAERVAAGALERFAALLGARGLPRRSLLPAYGLAEATLAVTGLDLAEEWATLPLDAAAVRVGARVPVERGAAPLVGCGRPLQGVTVRVAGEDGASLPDGHAGEIVVGGASVAAGYHDEAEDGRATRFAGGEVATGDVGFVHDGQLYVLGRLGDSIKLRGRTLFAEDVEAALAEEGVPRHRQAVLLGHTDRPVAVVVVEHADPSGVAAAAPLVGRLTEGAEVVVVTAPVGSVPRTTSGKPRRRTLWRRFVAGELPGTPVPLGDLGGHDDRTSEGR